MKKIFILFSFLCSLGALAQDAVGPLTYNPRLYYSTARGQQSHQNNRYKNFVIVEDSNLIVESDTLNLPFIDDFSFPTLKPYNYVGYIKDTIYNAIGPCDTIWPVGLVSDTFSLYPTYTYTYNTITKTVDSTRNAPVVFLNSPITGECFYNLGDTAILYPIGYKYFFDTITGRLIYKIRDSTDVLVGVTYAPALARSKAPKYTNWLDNDAFQNNTFAYLPPSIGVVTFDGTNSLGQPYVGNNPAAWGMADVLTSKPLFMGSYTDADSVYLSFFYEPGGFGYGPTPRDSFVLQFYNGYTSQWDDIWSVSGDSSQLWYPTDSIQLDTPDIFKQVILRIPSTNISSNIQYFYDGFQFRFLNYGSLTGINTIWNLDYVRLAANRNFTDTVIRDLSFQYQFPSILKNYTEMPAEQFTGNADLADTIQLLVSNLNQPQAISNPPATTFTISSSGIYPTPVSVVLAPTNNTFNAGLENTIYLFPSTQDTLPVIGTNDSVIIQSQAVLDVSDVMLSNDTINHTQVLSNVLAYDDGTAELTYGAQYLTSPTSKFAYEFALNYADSLVGFQVLYTTIGIDVHDLAFDFNLWDTLQMGNVFYTDSPVWTSNVTIPYYIDSLNGFTTYRLPQAVPLPKHFYFGWSQTDQRNLQIGYDMNSHKGREHMYFFTSRVGMWGKSTISTDGSPMIRLLLGHSYQTPSGIKNVNNNPVKAHPNPTSGLLTFDLPDAGATYSLQLYNMMGQMCLSQTMDNNNNTINMGSLNVGLYLVKLTDNTTGVSYQNKIEKSTK